MSRLSRWFRVEQVSINAFDVLFWGGCVVVGLGLAVGLTVWGNRHPGAEQEKVVAPPAPPPPPAEPPAPLPERAGQAVGRGGVQLGRGLWDGVRNELFGKGE